MDSVPLQDYLDGLSRPALVLHCERHDNRLLLDDGALRACHANRVFLDILNETGVHSELTRLLQTKWIQPSTSQMLAWVESVLQGGKFAPRLRTSFNTGDGGTDPQVIDIEWEPTVVHSDYLVLTGEILGKVSYSGSPRNNRRPSLETRKSDSATSRDEDFTGHTAITTSAGSSSGSYSSKTNTSRPLRGRQEGGSVHFTPTYLTEAAPSTTPHQTSTWEPRAKIPKSLVGGGVMGELMQTKNWNKTKFGPIDVWPSSLLSMVSLVMSSSSPMALWWGPEHLLIYNDGFIPIADRRHPSSFGEPAKKYWDDDWARMNPIFDRVMGGESISLEDECITVRRDDSLEEETYLTWSYIPWREGNGDIGGFLNPCYEATERVLADRRLRTLGRLDSAIGKALTMNDLGKSISEAFTYNPYDIPFALVYFCSTKFSTYEPVGLERRSTSDADSEMSEDHKDPRVRLYTLQSTIGIPEGHELAPKQVEIHFGQQNTHEMSIWPFRKMTQQPQLMKISLDSMEGVHHQGWKDAPDTAVAIPLFGARDLEGRELMTGMLIMGINPRRKFDDDYREWTQVCSRHIAAAMNLTESAEEAVQRTEEMAALNRDRTAFFNSVSHELRTPLTLILGPLEECIDDTSLAAPHKDRLVLVRRNARRLLRLINSLLDFSRLEAGKMSASYKETDLQKVTADMASLFRSAIEKGGVKYEVVTDGEGEPVWIDHAMWEKIVFNVIGNAFKFTLTGRITVKCALAPYGTHMLFSVEDTGVGIPPHEVPRIFEKFHRAHEQGGRSFEGTGIGLALTQELVKLHGGKMQVESTFGDGTTFTVLIPVGNTHLPQEQLSVEADPGDTGLFGTSIVEEAGRWGPLNQEDSSSDQSTSSPAVVPLPRSVWIPPSTAGSTVLIVDDNEDVRRFVKGVLMQCYSVVEASNGRDALTIIKSAQPDLIISDVMMPGSVNGFALLKILRSSSSIPFIFVSAEASEKARLDGLQAGADDYLAKPFSPDELMARVHTLLDNGRMRKELEKRVREMSKDLLESEARFRLLCDVSPAGIFQLNTAGKVTYGNPRWYQLSGGNDYDDFIEFVHPEDRSTMLSIWKEALEGGNSTFELRWGTEHSFVWVLGELVPEISDDLREFIGVLTDVTERRRLEAAKLASVEEARAQQELAIDIICHELRNPLNGIYHNAEMVHDSIIRLQKRTRLFKSLLSSHTQSNSHIEPDVITQFIDDLETEFNGDYEAMELLGQCARHQNRIADDVLQMSKLSMNLVSITEAPFDPVIEMQNCIRMFQQAAIVKKIEMMLSVGEEYTAMDLKMVIGDPVRFAQVILNSLSNAIRFTEKSEIRTIKIFLNASTKEPKYSQNGTGTTPAQQGLFLISSITDSGIGLTPEEQSKLFQKFTQASPKTHVEYGGTGLGLFISRALVEAHGGKLVLESEKDHGTMLSFYIRVRKVDVDDKFLPKFDGITRTASPNNQPNWSRTSNMRILIVEDNLVNQKVLERQLELEGFKTVVANHGRECLDILTESSPEKIDVILMDMEMPVMGGLECAEEIRRREASGMLAWHIPIIAVTGNARAEYVKRASSVGIDYFIVKPYNKKALIQKIHELATP